MCRKILSVSIGIGLLVSEWINEIHGNNKLLFEKFLLNKVQKRVTTLNGTIDVEADGRSVSVLLLVPVK